MYDNPRIPWTARKNGRWIQSIPLSSRVFFCLLFSQSDWWIINQSFAIFCAFFDRWWEATQGWVFRRARVKEIRETLSRPCEKPSDWEWTTWTIDENSPHSFHLFASKYRVPCSKRFKCNCFLNGWRWCFCRVKSLNKETDYVRRSIWIDNPHE